MTKPIAPCVARGWAEGPAEIIMCCLEDVITMRHDLYDAAFE